MSSHRCLKRELMLLCLLFIGGILPIVCKIHEVRHFVCAVFTHPSQGLTQCLAYSRSSGDNCWLGFYRALGIFWGWCESKEIVRISGRRYKVESFFRSMRENLWAWGWEWQTREKNHGWEGWTQWWRTWSLRKCGAKGLIMLLVYLKINNCLGLPLTKAQNSKGRAAFPVGDTEQLRGGRYGFAFGKAEWRRPWEIHVNIELKGELGNGAPYGTGGLQ